MGELRWLNETEMRAWMAFLETSERVRRLVEEQLREAGRLTMVQYEILHWANEHAGRELCMTELVELMIGSRSGLSYQVTQMEKNGLLRRATDPEDERRVLVTITEEGRRLLTEAAPGHVTAVREGLIDRLSGDQVTQLADIMDTARHHLRAITALRHARPSQKRAAPNRIATRPTE